MATVVPSKKNTVYVFYIGLVSQVDPRLLQVNPTLAAGDVKVATDDGAPGNLATLPVVDADFTKRVKVSLSAGEMNGDNITVIFSDVAGAEWCDLIVNIQTVANQIDDVAAKTNLLPDGVVKNTPLNNFMFLMVASTDHITPKTGLAITAERSIDGAAFAACANATSELSAGIYNISFDATDLNGDVICFKFTAAGADARFITIKTQT